MFNIKYLEYFIVSADMGSFSKAATVLYTTQSNISKGIKTLEEYVGDALFVRKAKGIALTPQGKHVYKYASRIMEDMGALRDFTKNSREKWIHIVTNPSSWVADRFVEFYNLHSQENFHWRILTGSVEYIMRRVADYKDELGLVYVMEGKKASFQYMLSRNHLEFTSLAQAEPMIYLGKGHSQDLTETDMQNLRFVQGYRDAFSQSDHWIIPNGKEEEWSHRDVAVVTNSDYIMERLLLNSQMANISTNYLTDDEHRIVADGIPLHRSGDQAQKDDAVFFGYLKREKEALSKWAQAFISYMQEVLG